MAKTLLDKIEEFDLEEVLENEKKHATKQICHKCNLPLMEYKKTLWDKLHQITKLTCPECGYFKDLKTKKLN
jgi:RNase P subunit RPR2